MLHCQCALGNCKAPKIAGSSKLSDDPRWTSGQSVATVDHVLLPARLLTPEATNCLFSGGTCIHCAYRTHTPAVLAKKAAVGENAAASLSRIYRRNREGPGCNFEGTRSSHQRVSFDRAAERQIKLIRWGETLQCACFRWPSSDLHLDAGVVNSGHDAWGTGVKGSGLCAAGGTAGSRGQLDIRIAVFGFPHVAPRGSLT